MLRDQRGLSAKLSIHDPDVPPFVFRGSGAGPPPPRSSSFSFSEPSACPSAEARPGCGPRGLPARRRQRFGCASFRAYALQTTTAFLGSPGLELRSALSSRVLQFTCDMLRRVSQFSYFFRFFARFSGSSTKIVLEQNPSKIANHFHHFAEFGTLAIGTLKFGI